MFLTGIEEFDETKIEQYMGQLLDWLAGKLFDVLLALLFLVIGFRLVKLLAKGIKKSFRKSDMEESVSGFLVSLIKGGLYAVVVITAAAIMGFQVTSLVTILGTASLAIGLALQGSLANFAGGVLILMMKPFRVGDYILENDKKCEGTVVSIDIFYTKLKTYDNKIVVIPNGNITANSIVNFTAEKERRLDITVGIAYDADIKLAKETLLDIVTSSKYSLEDRDMIVFVDSFQESSILMGVRCYVNTEDYWSAKWEITEQIKLTFDSKGIEIPYSKLEVQVKK